MAQYHDYLFETEEFQKAIKECEPVNPRDIKRIKSYIIEMIRIGCKSIFDSHTYYFVKYGIKYGKCFFDPKITDSYTVTLVNINRMIQCYRALEYQQKYGISAKSMIKKVFTFCFAMMRNRTSEILVEKLQENWIQEYTTTKESILLHFKEDEGILIIKLLQNIKKPLELLSDDEIVEDCAMIGDFREVLEGITRKMKANPLFEKLHNLLLKRVLSIFYGSDKDNEFLGEWFDVKSNVWKFRIDREWTLFSAMVDCMANYSIEFMLKKIETASQNN